MWGEATELLECPQSGVFDRKMHAPIRVTTAADEPVLVRVMLKNERKELVAGQNFGGTGSLLTASECVAGSAAPFSASVDPQRQSSCRSLCGRGALARADAAVRRPSAASGLVHAHRLCCSDRPVRRHLFYHACPK